MSDRRERTPKSQRPGRTARPAPSAVDRFLAAAAAAPKPAPVIERPAAASRRMIARRPQTMTEILRHYGHVPPVKERESR